MTRNLCYTFLTKLFIWHAVFYTTVHIMSCFSRVKCNNKIAAFKKTIMKSNFFVIQYETTLMRKFLALYRAHT